MLMEPIYEQDFHDESYGFRPRRSPHDARDALWKETMRIGGGWILQVDLRKFFDTLDHAHLRNLVGRRIRDTWEKFERLEKRYPLPLPKIYHPGST